LDLLRWGVAVSHCGDTLIIQPRDASVVNDRITADPKVLVGKPVIRGTRIPVYVILELLAAGNTRDEILQAYPQLTAEDVIAAIEYASLVLRGELVDAR